ncbi:ribose-5-phosphate isomerase RpiA [Sphingopyxis sp. SE2]|uniref:ribose-5-phosphate isomerase RpiA n=1 Tax=Sphingopyxis sp. SE2 TaxID=1586240 RepID=UPI0028C0EFE7|nr:ribose-5-phosphate isomerase RpiA [Sphingopyxis sp. SE2]MDT7531223.1 ribose-5-phosphate isomerase RpiA [Sphingopyxis sp. SE2]
MSNRDRQKRAAAEAAVAEIDQGMLVGIGTGTTVAFAIAALGERVRRGWAIRAVATSVASEQAARKVGIAIEDFSTLAHVDLAIDGIDEIDPAFRAIKGAGGALLREKVVASAAKRMIAIGDASKPVVQLGNAPVPLEVLPFAQSFVAARIEALGGTPVVRGSYRTDQGNPIVDCSFGLIGDPPGLAVQLSAIPGVLGHGLFLHEIDELYIGRGDRVSHTERPARG